MKKGASPANATPQVLRTKLPAYTTAPFVCKAELAIDPYHFDVLIGIDRVRLAWRHGVDLGADSLEGKPQTDRSFKTELCLDQMFHAYLLFKAFIPVGYGCIIAYSVLKSQ